MNSIKDRLATVRQELDLAAKDCGRDPAGIQLVAVSKKKPVEAIREALAAGVTHLGENYIQEAVDKIERLGPIPAQWHFIGHLQSNKARFAVAHFDLIHTVDRIKLAREINRQAEKLNKVQSILIQVNISREFSKSGTSADQALNLARQIAPLPHVRLEGVMGMPPFLEDPEETRPYFRALARIRRDIEGADLPGVDARHLSMGMTHDFKVAIQEGATLVRIGTAVFGSRQ